MGGLFDYDSKLFQFLLRVSDLVALSLLWLVCSLPVITIGASTAALYYTAMKLVRQRGDGAVSMFFHSFRQNFRASLPVTLILLFVGYMLCLDFMLLSPKYGGSGVFHGICIVVLLAFSLEASFAFPVLAKFQCTTRQVFRNAFYIAVTHPLVAVMVTALHLIPVWLIYAHLDWFESVEPLLVLFGPGLIAYVNATALVPVFRQYVPAEQGEENERKG